MKLTPKLLIAGSATYVLTASGAYLYLRSKAPPQRCDNGKDKRGNIFDSLADHYDQQINLDETLMGIKLMRLWLMRQASGVVLETSVGTSRNLPYYKLDGGAITKLILTDTSTAMLARAKEKLSEYEDSVTPVEVATADAESLSTVFDPDSIDTVIDTMGLCSCEDPIAALKEMGRVCKPSGKILLLEHGRGTWSIVNSILDRYSERHCSRWGCQWNRDILGLIEKAGLRIERISRWHFGTTYLVVCRKPGYNGVLEGGE